MSNNEFADWFNDICQALRDQVNEEADMGQVGAYLIWAGEKMQEEHPNRSWDEIMSWLTHHDPRDIPECYSMKNYLEEVENGKSQQASGASRSNGDVSGEYQMAGKGESDAGQPGLRNMEDSAGSSKTSDRYRFPVRG